ncbi:MAG TPA: 16S rRNA (guanine(966)-N(2))-methyltransferase RsmD [Candidatus Hydrogenedentes bacterium]|nr:16S rRNA (guanine(966)-N(2))-methyltransferase RsmD [Candidatus Hydrogenedentota bacterium]HNT87971.1 16S rRNA (guanine(966)-N(2))-methyltransferase RsmD [Candidatus Hydrogenedentota bacterium]
MRVIAGRARGVRLEEPGDLAIRPTLDRVREALFSILGPRLPRAHFLDLFAGTGANGIEAISRGAASATFVDSHPRAVALIRRNLAKAGLHTDGRVLLLSVPEELPLIRRGDTRYDIVFADPPHAFNDFAGLLDGLAAGDLLAAQGVVVLEHDPRAAAPDAVGGLSRYRMARYGRTALSFFS